MSVAQFQVIAAGPQVSFQDIGRSGHLRFGITESGPMDHLAYAAGHAALGYKTDCALRTSIEVSIGGLVLACTYGQTTISVAGGAFQISIDHVPIAPWSVATIRTGQRLTIKPGKSGSWCYLAFEGELQAPKWLGHSATNASSGLGGGMLRDGQTIHVTKTSGSNQIQLPISMMNNARTSDPFRIVVGPQEHYFTPASIAGLTSAEFKMTAAYDRMGAKLSGSVLVLNDALSIPSEPIIRGSIQVAGDGQPTVLLSDHQASGGYPKIATLISADIDRFVQLRAPAKVCFEPITPAEAIEAARHYNKQKTAYLERVFIRHPSKMTRLLRATDIR